MSLCQLFTCCVPSIFMQAWNNMFLKLDFQVSTSTGYCLYVYKLQNLPPSPSLPGIMQDFSSVSGLKLDSFNFYLDIS